MMIIAIDGPAGAGKSTVTRELAARLGFSFLDTGAMYRAITWSALDRQVDFADGPGLLALATGLDISLDGECVFVEGRDVSAEIRLPEVTRNIFHIADHPGIRDVLVRLQRKIGASGNFVCEGRDQGTVAFPDAVCKIFLNASPQFRAMRRVAQLEAKGQYVDFDQVMAEQKLRDERDSRREVGRLMRAKDAVELNTDNRSIEEVVDTLVQIAREKIASSDVV